MAQRCAFSTKPGASAPSKPSAYERVFKQGATIVPRSFYFVTIPDLDGAVDYDKLYWAETDAVQAEEAKQPYKDVKLSGLVEGRFIYASAVAKHLLPFLLLKPAIVVLPVELKHGLLTLQSADALTRAGYREFGKWIARAEDIWRDKRGQKANRQNLEEWLDHQGRLTAQKLSQRYLVLYNTAGTNVSAACFDRLSSKIAFIVDHMLYWAAFSDIQEADYLAALLNSSTANDAIKPFQSTGLLGERHIHKKLLDLPIPTYNSHRQEHRQLAELGERARQDAIAVVKSQEFPSATSLARQRAFVRQKLKNTLAEIDKFVRLVL